MSEQNISVSPSPNSIDTLIGAGMRIEGRVACAGVLRIQGEVLGDVVCDDKAGGKGFLIVDSSGSVTGKLCAAHIAIRGRVTGPLQSSQSIEIHEGAAVEGDVAFNKLAIHVGGVVNGLLDYTAAADYQNARVDRPLSVASEMPASPEGRQSAGTRKVAGIAALVAFVMVALWVGRTFVVTDSPAESLAGKGETLTQDAKGSPLASAENALLRAEPKVPGQVGSPQVAAPVSSMPEISQSRVLDDKLQGKVVTIKGANPNRPPGVFLLVANESTVLYRKKPEESGDGARIAIAQGQKMSVAVAQDELIRVGKGTDVVMYFQGQKVPESVIENGSWIRFVAR